MKRVLSTAGLALRLTWKEFVLILLATAGLQTALFLRQEVFLESYGFEWILDEQGVAFVGRLAMLAILGFILLRCGRKNTGYTLRRLGLREGSVTALWSVVFSGYFLLSWVAQLATVIGLYLWYAQRIPVESIHFFVASYRSAYFHGLLPLAEPMGYMRNIALCLSFGTMSSMLARQLRWGGKPWMFGVLVFLSFLIPQKMGSEAMDGILSLVLLLCVGGQWLVNREVARNAD